MFHALTAFASHPSDESFLKTIVLAPHFWHTIRPVQFFLIVRAFAIPPQNGHSLIVSFDRNTPFIETNRSDVMDVCRERLRGFHEVP